MIDVLISLGVLVVLALGAGLTTRVLGWALKIDAKQFHQPGYWD